MRYILILFTILFCSRTVNAQIFDFHVRNDSPVNVWRVLVTDTLVGSPYYGLGSWQEVDSMAYYGVFGGDQDFYKLNTVLVPNNTDTAYRVGMTVFGIDSIFKDGGGVVQIGAPDAVAGSALDILTDYDYQYGTRWFNDVDLNPRSFVNSVGAYYSRSWINISAHESGSGLGYTLLHPTNESFMIGVWSDVGGPGIIVRESLAAGSYNIGGMDSDGNNTWALMPDGQIKWGIDTITNMDTELHREDSSGLATLGAFRFGWDRQNPTHLIGMNADRWQTKVFLDPDAFEFSYDTIYQAAGAKNYAFLKSGGLVCNEVDDNTEDIYHDGDVHIGYSTMANTQTLSVIGRMYLAQSETDDNIFINGGNTSLSGTDNIAVGEFSGDDLTSGQANVLIGRNTGTALTEGLRNVAIGSEALDVVTTGDDNFALGSSALGGLTTGNNNIAIGSNTLSGANFTGNTGIGNSAGVSATGDYGVFIGNGASLFSTGNGNIAIGNESGLFAAGGSIAIGNQAGYFSDEANKLYIHNAGGSNKANGKIVSLIYGEMDATTANQLLHINAKVLPRYMGSTSTALGGYDASGYLTTTTVGWGLDLASGTLKADTGELATQYDLTLIASSASDADWYEVGGSMPPNSINDDMYSGSGLHGIGTTTPAKPLHVVGEARITGSGGTATTITGRDADEDLTDVTTGWGIDLTSGALVVDSSEVATQYDLTLVAGGGMTRWYLAASGTGGTEEVNDGETVTITGAGINVATRSAGNVTITGTEVDGSVTNEAWTIDGDDAETEVISNQTVLFTGAGIASTDYDATANTLTITATEVDGSTSNELQDITVTGASQPFTVDLSSDATDMTMTGAGITTVTRSGNAVTWTSTEVDGSTSNELNVIEEGNATVQSGNTNIDFQTLFDVATDGSGEVNISLDLSESTTVTTPETDDYVIMHDAGSAQHQKILWTDLKEDILSFEEDNISEGTGYILDVGTGIDLSVTGAEADYTLDFNEFTTDAATEGDEYVIIYDPSAGTQEKVLVTSVGGFDGNGIFSSANDGNTVPTDMDVVLTDHIDFGNGNFFVSEATDRIGMGTNAPAADLHIVGATGSFRSEAESAGTAASWIIEGKTDGGGVSTNQTQLLFDFTDADYASGVEQTATTISMNKMADLTQWTATKITMNEGTDADVFVAEKNADWNATNTTESHVAVNAGMAFTQNYEWTATGSDLAIDRSYYNIAVSGSGALGDEITLPEVASTSDNWDSALTSIQAQVGQKYVISNFRAATNLVVRVFTGDDINGTTTISIAPLDAVIIECVRYSGGVGYWRTWTSD